MYAIKGIKKIIYWGIKIIIKSKCMVIAENYFVNWSHLVMAHLIINAHLIVYTITSVNTEEGFVLCQVLIKDLSSEMMYFDVLLLAMTNVKSSHNSFDMHYLRFAQMSSSSVVQLYV